MQTILGATGQIAEGLTRELYRNFTRELRLVSRSPHRLHETDQLFPADLTDGQAASQAVQGSEVAYFTVGLPMDSRLWEAQFPLILNNVIGACRRHGVKLVFFDNTYMYAKTADPQTEESPFRPVGRKSVVRARMAERVLAAMADNSLEALIARAPEFYGPGKTQSITNTLIFENIRQRKKLKVPQRDDTRRTLIWTPDASRATALLGNTPGAYGQTWHLPCDDAHPTYRELVHLCSQVYGRDFSHAILKRWQFRLGGYLNKQAAELQELLPRYGGDTLFVSEKFKKAFPDFPVTPYREGILYIKCEQEASCKPDMP